MEIGNDHVHTWRSDGELTELEIILYALTNHIRRIELTDHDTVMGWSPGVIEAINQYISGGVHFFPDGRIHPENPKFIRPEYVRHILQEGGFPDYKLTDYHLIEEAQPGVLKCGPSLSIGKGVEVTSSMGKTFHILGLLLSDVTPDFQIRLDEICRTRRERASEILSCLYEGNYFSGRTLEFLRSSRDPSFSEQQLIDSIGSTSPVTIGDVLAVNPNAPSRLTIGFLLWRRYGHSIYGDLTPEQVRDIYLKRSPQSRFNIPSFSPKEAIAEIIRSGGIPVLAHPNEGRPVDSKWLENDFGILESERVNVGELVETGVISSSDIIYAKQHGIIGCFRRWGVRGVEHSCYANTHRLLDFSAATDYHGPNMKREREIRGGNVPSLDSLLNIKVIQTAHNTLYWKMRSDEKYSAWRESLQGTEEVLKGFPSTEEMGGEQKLILSGMPRPIDTMPTLGEYLEMTAICEINPPYFRGTVLEMAIDLQAELAKIIEQSSYITTGEETEIQGYNYRISLYLGTQLGTFTRKDILKNNLPFLHNIGKVLALGIEECSSSEGALRYRTTFVQHDAVGAELIDNIRPVLKEQQELTDEEVDHIRDVALYHCKVHDIVYRIMSKLPLSESQERLSSIYRAISSIIESNQYKPDIILDSLLIIKAAGQKAYSGRQDQYPLYLSAIDEFMKACVDSLRPKTI
ncbi:MAG: hypothetical protein KKC75_05425 [Nanoarchaeota archaeon]|nr:hypothetical protein [Nanoarchaeota archaeon]MBU1005013.1 hypothetical protein [Nanoarchaeota archaeon]MBU1945905.1 hypothetical protein [Nanoarchaeota archaeon]